eukprot:56495_1
MAAQRFSHRIQSNVGQSNQQTSEQKQEEVIRRLYAADIAKIDLAFIRLNTGHDPKQHQNDKDTHGVLTLGSIPERVDKLEWGTKSLFSNEDKLLIVDSFRLINEDTDYAAHMESLTPNQWADKQIFFDEHHRVGRDIIKVEKNAYSLGKQAGIKQTPASFGYEYVNASQTDILNG